MMHITNRFKWMQFAKIFLIVMLVGINIPAWSDQREIKVLRQTPSALDRAISDHLCMSFKVMNPYYRCQEVYLPQGSLTQKELAEYDFIITSEQFFNEQLRRNFQLVLPLYHQAFTVVTRDVDQSELTGRGHQFGMLEANEQKDMLTSILKTLNIEQDRLQVNSYNAEELIDHFCGYDVNVAFVTGAHPNMLVRQLNTLCGGVPISIVQSLPKNFFQKNRYFYQITIPKEYYWRLPEDIETLSFRYLLAVNNRITTEMLDELMDNFMKEMKYNPGFAITESSILLNYENLQTPLHDVGNELIEDLQETFVE
ncbi:TAXI family TRAP transporter solute-binding subunit [Ignatzschineria sp. LJL83]